MTLVRLAPSVLESGRIRCLRNVRLDGLGDRVHFTAGPVRITLHGNGVPFQWCSCVPASGIVAHSDNRNRRGGDSPAEVAIVIIA